ncbi:MAG TPA: ABC transporter permease [Edaphobacter sp.]|nr:ABC transporter permease [Edaphobacter sp.]
MNTVPLTSRWSRLRSWLRSMASRTRLEDDMEEELRFHLEARTTDLMQQGLLPNEAARRARIEFGTIATHKADMRRSLGLRWWDDLSADLRYAIRILRKSPTFTLIAVSSLALAIGANTSIFSLANELMYERLGVPHPEQLRTLTLIHGDRSAVHARWGSNNLTPGGKSLSDSFSYPIYQQLRANNHVLDDIFAFKDINRSNVTIDGSAQTAQIELVSGNFYTQMQVRPVLGRAILPSDDAVPNQGTIAVISDALWSRSFGRSPAVLGKVITVNMIPVTIVGVNPPGFTGARSVQSSPDLFIPLSMISSFSPFADPGGLLTNANLFWVNLMARIPAGVNQQQAYAELNTLFTAALRSTMSPKPKETIPELRLYDGSRGLNFYFSGTSYRQPLYVLLGLVGLVLIIACANIANLMLARASVRQREMGVRLALGASRSRILRQVLTESLLISAIGGALGLLFGYLSRSALPNLVSTSWRDAPITVPFNWKIFCFTSAITLFTGILFGLAPAWSSTRAEIGTALKETTTTSTRQHKALSGRLLIAFQVALSTLLLAVAGLFIRTLINLNTVNPAFRVDHLLLFNINTPRTRYPEAQSVALHTRIEAAFRSVPGVQGVTLTDIPLIANTSSNADFHVEGSSDPGRSPKDREPSVYLAHVGSDFFKVLGIPIVSGRAFTPQDAEGSRGVAVINQTLAHRLFPTETPLGKRFKYDSRSPLWLEIVGICSDTPYESLKEEGAPMIHFDLYRQQLSLQGATYMVRTDLPAESIVPSLRAALQHIDRDLPITDIRTQRQQINATIQTERVLASLTIAFGILALALACVGIYGIMTYTVTQRTNEIGIRLALGAQRGRVRTMVLRESAWLTIFGIIAGLVAAVALSRLIKSMLYGLSPTDPVSLTAAALLLLAVALFASWLPAARASRIEPMEALRHE